MTAAADLCRPLLDLCRQRTNHLPLLTPFRGAEAEVNGRGAAHLGSARAEAEVGGGAW